MKRSSKYAKSFKTVTVICCAIFAVCSNELGGLAKSKDAPTNQSVAVPEPETQMPTYEEGKKLPKGMAESSVDVTIASTPENVWKTLTNFEIYPKIFKRIKSSEITKREGDFVFLETYLKPQRFVKNQVQHTVTNIAASPNHIVFKQLDGNFKHVDGAWDLAALDRGRTKLKYTLHVDSGTIVPPPLVSFFLKFVQNEVVNQVKQYVESDEKSERKKQKTET